MKKLIVVSLCALLMLGMNAFGVNYTYTVSGKVCYFGGSIPVPKGTAVTFTANWTGGGSVQNTVYTAGDGSFSVSHSLGTINPVGASMSLKAIGVICSGAKSWICAGSAEAKNVSVFCNMTINPNLAVTVGSSRFAGMGIQPPVTTVAFLDQSGTLEVQQFQVKIAWNPAQMNVANIQTSPGSPFTVTWYPTGPDSAMVHGESPIPVSLGPLPDSFFDVFFEVILPPESMPAISTVTVVPEETVLLNGGMYFPYLRQSDYFLGEPQKCQAEFLIDDANQWRKPLTSQWPNASISPMLESEWERHMALWTDPDTIKQGLPYPENTFLPAQLWVYGGGGGGGLNPSDAGLVMFWGTGQEPDGNYASAFRYDYGLDPDLRNKTITVTVTAPQFGQTGQINAVSFAINDIAGQSIQWWWNVGPGPAPIPWNVPTKVTINTAIAGIGAATPAATGYAANPGFNMAQAQSFDVDENFQWVFQPGAIPPPGQPSFMGMWNYWHNLIVTPNTSAYKGNYVKWSQKPVVDTNGMINGWDEFSCYTGPVSRPIIADDWECKDARPVTDIHWWGSFINWNQPKLPPVLPTAFHIGIWTDVPDPDPCNPLDFSHPGTLIWENTCDSWVWNFAGFDKDPQGRPERENEACFQFNQLLSQDEWFYQEPNGPDGKRVYWLSISAIYPQGQTMQYPFGWKTRPHHFNDDAVRIGGVIDPTGLEIWPPVIGSQWAHGMPIKYPETVSWDMAFELTTNEEGTPSADFNHDGIVNFVDFAVFANQWLTAGP